MKKILVTVPLLLLSALILKYAVPFIYNAVFGLFLVKETTEAILPNWLTYVFEIIAGIITVFVLHFGQSEKRFEVASTIISFIFIVIASHIARYSWLHFVMMCLTLICVILKLIKNIVESSPMKKEN